jgi:acetyl esterase/lipase
MWGVRCRSLLAVGVSVAAIVGVNAFSSPSSSASSRAATTPAGTGPVPRLSAGQSATVTYCNDQKARITEPPKPKLDGRAPAAVYVHGGSWVSGNFNTGGFLISKIGPALAAYGFVVMSLDYRLGPRNRWPDQIEDVKCAIRYLRANAKPLNVNPNHIGAWGHSAGGHLVSLLGTVGGKVWDVGAYQNESSRVEAVIDLAGPTDLRTLGDRGISEVVENSFISLLGKVKPKDVGAALEAASPVTYVAAGDPPFLLLHSDNDEIVFFKQSQDLAWELAAAGVPEQLVVVHNGGHEFDQPGEVPDEGTITNYVLSFFVKYLHPAN